jgi:hypothetical protein
MWSNPLAQRVILLFGKARGSLRARVAHALQIFPAPPLAPHGPMFAPHANPHARAVAERVVSRRDLHSDSEGEGEADEEGVRALRALVRRALGDGDGGAEARAPKRRKVEENVDVVRACAVGRRVGWG